MHLEREKMRYVATPDVPRLPGWKITRDAVDVNTTEVPVIGTFVREPDHPVYGFAMREDIAWCITRLLEKFSNLLFSWRIRQFAYRA
ncbi:hypothetical protein FS842_008436 [Serendipita sp. 407]|nr:hypothetical protein FS842_008436 [Serendipita sp. 407]